MPRVRPECGNPLLRDWVAEWMEELRGLQSKSYFTYKKAHDSLAACPTPFAHPSESQQLAGIGVKIANRLERKMLDYCEENGLPVPQRPNKGKRRLTTEPDSGLDSDGPNNNKRARPPPRPYIPQFRTGGYAILLTLLDFKDEGQVAATKNEIIRQGQSYCDASMDLAEPGSNYTAWSGIKILKDKGYVWQNGSPPRFSLTESGEAMAEQLRMASNDDAPSTSTARRRVGTTTSSSHDNNSSQNNTAGPPEVDLSLYVLNPDSYRRDRATPSSSAATTTTTTTTTSASTTPDVDLSLYVLNPDSYRRDRATSLSETAATTSTSTTPEVDLSLYVLNPESYRRERATSTAASTSTQKPASSIATTATTNRPQLSFYTNLDDDDDDDDDEPTIDLSQPDSYRQENTSTPVSRNSNTNNSNNSNNNNNNNNNSQPQQDSIAFSLHLPSRQRADPADDIEIITLLSPTPSPPNSPIRPTASLHSSQAQDSPTNLFQYTYLNTSDDPVRHISQAALEIDGERGCLMYKIRFSRNQKQHSRIRSLVDVNHDTCTGYFLENDADVVCPGLPARPLLPLHHEQDEQAENDFWPDLSQPTTTTTTTITNSQQSIRMDPIEKNRQDPSTTTRRTTTTTTATAPTEAILDIPTMISTAKQEGRVWQPEDYTIVMILDNREVKMKTNREYIQDKLIEKGVAVEKRALDVGDVLWVAKHVETDEEMYLDIVLERKRMDDLVSSVKDGRFHEQKYRLKQSASRKVFYVVEEYSKESALKFGAQAIQTAMSCVQAVDQFYLKRTGNLDDTIDYLVRLTKMIGKLYRNIKLQEIPIQLIHRSNYFALKMGLSDDEASQPTTTTAIHHVIPYTIFNHLNSKSGSSTLQDLYTKMLMAIRGVNAEKAYALTRVYPTPYQLLKAMDESAANGGGKQLAVRATKEGISRRRWGSAISERLWEVWGKQHH